MTHKFVVKVKGPDAKFPPTRQRKVKQLASETVSTRGRTKIQIINEAITSAVLDTEPERHPATRIRSCLATQSTV